MEQTGRMIGEHYRIVRKLGEGGRGSVYLVMNVATEHFWAAKRIPFSDSRYGHEAEVMKNLRNPHLPVFIDVIREEGAVWLIMEYIRGICLSRYLEGGRTLPEEQVLEIAAEVCDALCYLQSHSPPVFHLDIKPSNLIRTMDGKVKLVDFGAAFREDTDPVNEGTEGYAAPEQYDRQVKKDGRTDIYGLGATMFRLASGKRFTKELRGSRVPGCGEELSDVIARCLMEKPEDRFQTAAELLTALFRIRRKYSREKKRRQLLSACAIALPATALCVSVLPGSLNLSADEDWDYGKLLHEAGCVTEERSREYYQKAVFLQPENPEAYLRLVEDAGADGTFSGSEEEFLRNMLHSVPLGESITNEEILQQEPFSYGELAEQIGVLYRYEYEGDEGKRIASGWFRKALEAGKSAGESASESKPAWEEAAEYYSSLEKLEEAGEAAVPGGTEAEEVTEEESVTALMYWETLKDNRKYLHPDTDSEPDLLLNLHRIRDTLWQLAFRVHDLCEAGVSPELIHAEIENLYQEAENEEESLKLSGKDSIMEDLSGEIREARDLGKKRLSMREKSAGNME